MDAEILVRFDDDDAQSLAIRDDLISDGIRVFVGSRLQGYVSLASFYEELAHEASAPWISVMNDDAYVIGEGWDAQLAEIPTDGVIVQPELYKLGGSGYRNCEGGAFPLVPTDALKKVGCDRWYGPGIDTFLDQLLRVQHGWRTQFIKGMTVVHERDNHDAIERHRKL